MRRSACFGLMVLLLAAIAHGRLDFEGWAYNVTSGSGNTSYVYNYSQLHHFNLIRNESNLDIYYKNSSTWLAMGASLDATQKTLSFTDNVFPRLYVLGEIIDVAINLKCKLGSSWVDCSTLQQNDILNEVKVTCSDPHEWNVEATFSLGHSEDAQAYFHGNSTSSAGTVYTLDNDDEEIDQGNYSLKATCIDKQNRKDSTSIQWQT